MRLITSLEAPGLPGVGVGAIPASLHYLTLQSAISATAASFSHSSRRHARASTKAIARSPLVSIARAGGWHGSRIDLGIAGHCIRIAGDEQADSIRQAHSAPIAAFRLMGKHRIKSGGRGRCGGSGAA